MQLNSLKSRFIVAVVITVTASSFLFAFVLLSIKDRLEEATFGSMVREQLQLIKESEDIDYAMHMMAGWEIVHGDNIGLLPAELAELSNGSHHSIRVDANYYQVEVGDIDGEPLMLLYDITEWENQEHAVLAILAWGLLVVLALAIVLAILSAKPALKPVRDLTRRLASIQPDDRKQRIGTEFADSEIGVIANEVDRYLARLDDFVDREKFYTTAASHELRTPLSVVMGAVDVMEAQGAEGVSQRALSRIKRACEDMLAFIETTLYLAREESQGISELAECHLGSLTEELLKELEPQIEIRRLTITNKIDTDPVVKASPSLTKIVVSNLLRNAIEHTQEGNIEISYENSVLTIADQGEGITAENLEKLFDRSFSTKTDGTGMGLNLVKRICDRLGWVIEFTSQTGVGTIVRITMNSINPIGEAK
jgi:signal transduction histidine kinase